MEKLTTIVATIGPATESEEQIEQLINAGMDVARFNTKHNEPSWHQEKIELVKKVATKLNKPVATLLDLQGPEIRINLPDQGSFAVKEDEQIIFTSDVSNTQAKIVHIPDDVVDIMPEGSLLLLDDGLCEFEVVGKTDDSLTARALGDCEVKHRKTLNTPGYVIDMPSLIERDLEQLDAAAQYGVDFVGLSFVRDKRDIENLRQELKKRNIEAQIVAKIENQSALDHLDEIITASDAVMVARGDLAVEVPFEQLTFWQKLIIAKCRMAAKPVITATQMLRSMVDHPRPTRAEVSDVANAIYDSTSAVMLSEETTIGKYPVKAVENQAKIALFNEKYVQTHLEDWLDQDNSSSITHSAMYMVNHNQQIDSLVCLTETGTTAGLLSRFRPKIPIYALTSNDKTYRKLALHFGVLPHIMEFPAEGLQEPEAIAQALADKQILAPGKTALIIYGSIWKTPGLTNSISIVKIPPANQA